MGAHGLQGWISEDNLMLWFLVAVIVAALNGGVGPAMQVSFLSFLALDFGVFKPHFHFTPPDFQYCLSLLTFLAVGYVISKLSNALRDQAQEAETRAQIASELQALGRDLTRVQSPPEVMAAFNRHTQVLFGDQSERVMNELAQEAPIPLEPFIQQARLALQRLSSEQEMRQALLVAERERVQNALLNSLSHDLQTPLASVAGSLQVACNPDLAIDPEVRLGLLRLAGEQTERLRRLVSNLLQMTRLDGPGLVINRQVVEVDELLGVVVDQIPASIRDRVQLQLAKDLPCLQVDYVLTVNLLLNLLENAHKYTPGDSPVEVHVSLDETRIRFDVRDRGPGLPPEDLGRIFEKFYRSEGVEQLSGSGLGLFIAKGIVDVHEGKILAQLRAGGGLEISCWLPAGEMGARPNLY